MTTGAKGKGKIRRWRERQRLRLNFLGSSGGKRIPTKGEAAPNQSTKTKNGSGTGQKKTREIKRIEAKNLRAWDRKMVNLSM